MPSLRGKSVLLKELNTLNGQSYTLTDVDIRRLSDVEHAQMVSLTSGVLANAGNLAFVHQAVGLEGLGSVWPGKIVILRTPTLLEAITRISQQLGITFAATDLVDTYIPDTGGVITLTAAPTSLVFKGTTDITVEVTTIPTKQIYPATDLTRTKAWTGTELVTALGVRNKRPDIQPSGFAVGSAKTITGTYNTEVPLTARIEYGYVGDTAVQYNRTDLTALGTQATIWNQPWTGTTHQFLQRFLPELATLLNPEDIVNSTVTFNGTTPIPIPVQTNPGALNAFGDLTVEMMVGDPNAYAKVRSMSGQTIYRILGTTNVRSMSGQTIYKVLGVVNIRNLCAQTLYKVN